MKILLTAFAGETNTSKLLLDSIRAADKQLLTNSFISSKKQMLSAIPKVNPDFLIALGQKPNVKCLYIETHARKDDALETNFDCLPLLESLKKCNIKYKLSDNAGNYLCNHVYYESLKYIDDNDFPTKVIFIHVPSKKNFDNFSVVSDWLNQYVGGCYEYIKIHRLHKNNRIR